MANQHPTGRRKPRPRSEPSTVVEIWPAEFGDVQGGHTDVLDSDSIEGQREAVLRLMGRQWLGGALDIVPVRSGDLVMGALEDFKSGDWVRVTVAVNLAAGKKANRADFRRLVTKLHCSHEQHQNAEVADEIFEFRKRRPRVAAPAIARHLKRSGRDVTSRRVHYYLFEDPRYKASQKELLRKMIDELFKDFPREQQLVYFDRLKARFERAKVYLRLRGALPAARKKRGRRAADPHSGHR